MKMIVLTILFSILNCSTNVFSEERIVYKYKKYERFDLGNMAIDGKIIAPSDLSVRLKENNQLNIELYIRKSYMEKELGEIKYFR